MKSSLIVVVLGLCWVVSEVACAADDSIHTFKADKRYIIFPCSRGLRGQNKVFIDVDGKPYMSVYDALIASSDPDHWRCIDLKLMQGKTLSVKIEGPNAAGIELVKTSDTIPGKYPVYQEPGRPKVHFSPIRGWLNDPSGMIYFEGKWHLYYANTRFNNVMAMANNAWGHATSTDLLHWEEQPIFLTPVRGKCSFWTGGAAVDVDNTTGLGKPGKPAIVFSANNGSDAPNSFTQCIFVSTDGGMTVRRNPEMMYKPLPVDDSRRGSGTRDPMILWYAPEKKWVMVVYVQLSGVKNTFCFFESKDLKNWTEMSVLEDMYECPNLFHLPVDGKQADTRWVTWGSNTEYRIGKFNGISVAVRNWTTLAVRTEPAGCLLGGPRRPVAPRDRDAEALAEILGCRVDAQAVNGCPQAELGSRGVALETTIPIVGEARREHSAACEA